MPEFAPLAKAFVLQKKVALAPHVIGHVYRVCSLFCEEPLDANQGSLRKFLNQDGPMEGSKGRKR